MGLNVHHMKASHSSDLYHSAVMVALNEDSKGLTWTVLERPLLRWS